MKNFIFICLLISSNLFAISTKEYDEYIRKEKVPLVKLLLKCEHPTKATPQICIDAANKMKNTKYSPELELVITENMIVNHTLKDYNFDPSLADYMNYFKTIFKPNTIANMYFNAGSIYEKQQFVNRAKAVEYFEKYLMYKVNK